MSICEYSKPLMGAAIAFLIYTVFMAIGLAMMPINASEHYAKCRNELRDAWQKAFSPSWQAPIFAVTFPIVLLGVLPIAFPLIAILIGFGVLLFCWWLQC